MVKMSGSYQGELRCRSKHGPSGSVLFTNAPTDNGGKGDAFSPTDLVAMALATCIATTMGAVARERGLDLKGLTYELTKEMAEDAPRRIARVAISMSVPLRRTPELAEAFDKVIKTCPVQQSLQPSVQVPVTLHWIG